MEHAFFLPDGDAYVATPNTRGPWDNRFQHGGPPSALLTGAMARFGEDAEDFAMARVTVELLRPVPIARLELRVAMERPGRTVQRLTAELLAEGKRVCTAQGLRIRRLELVPPELPEPTPWPDPESLPSFEFPFFQHEVGYHRAVDLRLAYGAWGKTPVGFWTRPRVALVAGRETSPLEALLVIADAQSGMGIPVDPKSHTFVNPDLSVYLDRLPAGAWLGFDIRSSVGPQGAGLSQSAIRDELGEFARSAQSLVVTPRGDQNS